MLAGNKYCKWQVSGGDFTIHRQDEFRKDQRLTMGRRTDPPNALQSPVFQQVTVARPVAAV